MNIVTQNTCKAITKKDIPCKNHPMKNFDYCYMHSFGKFKGIPLYKNPIIHLIMTAILAIGLFFIGPSRKKQEDIIENGKKTHEKLERIEDALQLNKNYQPVKQAIREELGQNLQQLRQNHIQTLPKVLFRTETFNKDSRYLALRALSQIMQKADINAKYVGQYMGDTIKTNDIIILGYPGMNIFVKELRQALTPLFPNATYDVELKEKYSKNIVTIVLIGEPLFHPNGTIEFSQND